jgi:hypothetical protein
MARTIFRGNFIDNLKRDIQTLEWDMQFIRNEEFRVAKEAQLLLLREELVTRSEKK